MKRKILVLGVIGVITLYLYTFGIPNEEKLIGSQRTQLAEGIYFDEEATAQFSYEIIPHTGYYTLKLNAIPSKVIHANLSNYLYQEWNSHSFGAVPNRNEYRLLLVDRGGRFAFGWCDNAQVSCANHIYEEAYVKQIIVKFYAKGVSTPVYETPLYNSDEVGAYKLQPIIRHMDYHTEYFLLYETHLAGYETAIVRTMIPVTRGGFISEPSFFNTTGRTTMIEIDTYGVNKVVIDCEGGDTGPLQFTKNVTNGENEILVGGLEPDTQYNCKISVKDGHDEYGYPIEKSKYFTTQSGLIDYEIVNIYPQSVSINGDQVIVKYMAKGDNLKHTFSYYSATGDVQTEEVEVLETAQGIIYRAVLNDLEYNTKYDYAINVEDTAHETNKSLFTDSFNTPIAPVTTTTIQLNSISVKKNTAFLKFEIINDYRKVTVQYRKGEYGKIEVADTDLAAGEHTAYFEDLDSSTKYNYIIEVETREGVVRSTGDFTTSSETNLPPSPTPTPPTPPSQQSSLWLRVLFYGAIIFGALYAFVGSFRGWADKNLGIKEVKKYLFKK